jgi:hypothetical protein
VQGSSRSCRPTAGDGLPGPRPVAGYGRAGTFGGANRLAPLISLGLPFVWAAESRASQAAQDWVGSDSWVVAEKAFGERESVVLCATGPRRYWQTLWFEAWVAQGQGRTLLSTWEGGRGSGEDGWRQRANN